MTKKRATQGPSRPRKPRAIQHAGDADGSQEATEELPDFSHLVTEDDAPVHPYATCEMHLLTHSLKGSWPFPETPIMTHANVGVFSDTEPVIVPDVFLAVGVEGRPLFEAGKRGRSYFMQLYRKAPDVAVEIVTEDDGVEMEKLAQYARLGVRYVVFHDPWHILSPHELRGFNIHTDGTIHESRSRKRFWMPRVGLGLTLWHGSWYNEEATWLRWYERGGRLLKTADERYAESQARIEAYRLQIEQAKARVTIARERIEAARAKRDRYARQLAELGIEVEQARFTPTDTS